MKSDNEAYWVPIMEKAAAKYFVNYENLDGGMMIEAYKMLTGMPVMFFTHSMYDTSVLFSNLELIDKAKWLITASNLNPYEGLPGKHAYTVLGTHRLIDCNGNEIEQLVKLRNPWAKEKYTGPWNDNDSNWTEEFFNQVNHTNNDDGVFFMPMINYKEGFDGSYFAMYEDWKVDTIDTAWDRSTKNLVWNITNPVQQDVVVGMEMYTNRLFPHGCDESEMMDMLALYVYDVKNKKYLKGTITGNQYAITQYPYGHAYLYL